MQEIRGCGQQKWADLWQSCRADAVLPQLLQCEVNGGVRRCAACVCGFLNTGWAGFSDWAEFGGVVVAGKLCQAFAAGITCEADTTRAVRTGFNRLTAAGGDFTISVLTIGNSGRC